MTDFLSEAWFQELNDTLGAAGPAPLTSVHRVVIEMSDAPPSGPHALTLAIGPEPGAEPGDHLAADAVLRLPYADALALFDGRLDSATALREGRVKLRGDVTALVSVLEWLTRAHPSARDES